MRGRINNLLGQRFGRLTVQSLAYSGRSGARWNCLCDCGNQSTPRGGSLLNGRAVSCGLGRCGSRFKAQHGQSHTPTYSSYRAMIARCTHTRLQSYPRYGGAGVVICEKWQSSFESFLFDMGERPPGTTLDRFPNKNGNYEPGNCRWATNEEQSRNKRNTKLTVEQANEVFALFEGGMRPAEIAKHLGISRVDVKNAVYPRKQRIAMAVSL